MAYQPRPVTTPKSAVGDIIAQELAKRPNLSLQSVPSDFEGEPSEWAVFRESGGRSDREFNEIARADTPLAALTAALAAPDTPRFRCKRCGRDEIDCRANGCERGPCPMEFVG